MKLKKIDIIAKINWKKETNMQFLPEFIVAIIIAAVHLFISFNLKLPDKYKSKFRMYSLVVNLLFVASLGAFYLFVSSSPLSDQGVNIYFNSLVAVYFTLFVPLAIALGLRLHTLIMSADIYSVFLKYVVIIGFVIVLAGIVSVGYPLFIFFFYGFAP